MTKRMINLYPETFQLATNTKEFKKAFKNGRIASMMGIEGGQMIDSSMAALRQFYELGVRYMTVSTLTMVIETKLSLVDPQLSYTLGRVLL